MLRRGSQAAGHLVAYTLRTDETEQPYAASRPGTTGRKPRAEGRFHLPDGRRLGYAEFDDPSGAVVLWFHGTLGARRQIRLRSSRNCPYSSRVVGVQPAGF